jgi:hypothetical protein
VHAAGDNASAEIRRLGSQQGNDEYGTPRWLIRRVTDAIGGQFALGPAVGAKPRPVAEERYTKAEDAIGQDWTSFNGALSLNPNRRESDSLQGSTQMLGRARISIVYFCNFPQSGVSSTSSSSL